MTRRRHRQHHRRAGPDRGRLARRSDEWFHQMQVLPIEIQQIELQILGAQRRRDQALQELNNQQRQIEHATEVLDFLRDKFTATTCICSCRRKPRRCIARCTSWRSTRRGRRSAPSTSSAATPRGGSSRTEPGTTCTTGLLAGERLRLRAAPHGEGLSGRERPRVRADQAHLAAPALPAARSCGCGPPAAARSTSRSGCSTSTTPASTCAGSRASR